MPDVQPNWTDINSNDWIDRYLPVDFRPYARLMRLDRPIGIWLLLIPCLWAVSMAGGRWPNIGLMALFALGAVSARGAGCVVNDIYDRDLDAQVERTSTRPLVTGEIQIWQAFILVGVLLLISFLIICCFNHIALGIAAASLVLIFTYPLMKRVTWWPQFFLGLTFNWGVLVGWAAVTGGIDFSTLFLYCAGIMWTLGYDTIYAHQDIEDDMAIGIKSTAILFGERSRAWVVAFYALEFLFLLGAGDISDLGRGFYICLGIAAGFSVYHLARWQINQPFDCMLRFRANRDIGLIVLAGIILGKMV